MRTVIAGTILSILLATAALVLAAAGQPLTNGTFDYDLAGWSNQGEVVWDSVAQAAALLPYVEYDDEGTPLDTESVLWQVFRMPTKTDQLSFDVTMDFGGEIPETDILSVTLHGAEIYRLTS